MSKTRICFVCLGNICRSPTAEAVFADLVRRRGLEDRYEIDSAGTGDWHVGERAHPETRAVGDARGVAVTSRSRQFVPDDFARFDYVIAMDHKNLAELERLAPDADARSKLHLCRDFDPSSPPGSSMPDPYYEGGFEGVFDLCVAAAEGLLAHLEGR